MAKATTVAAVYDRRRRPQAAATALTKMEVATNPTHKHHNLAMLQPCLLVSGLLISAAAECSGGGPSVALGVAISFQCFGIGEVFSPAGRALVHDQVVTREHAQVQTFNLRGHRSRKSFLKLQT